MSDAVVLRGIEAAGRHGVLDFEQERPQPFDVDLVLEMDLAPAAASDDLADTADYGALVEAVVRLVAERSYRLLEALAGAIADDVLAGTPAVTAVTVEVRKVRPPVAARVAEAGVRLHRTR